MSVGHVSNEEWLEFQKRYEKLRENEELYRVAIALTDHTITVIDIPTRTLNQIYNEGDWTGVASSMPNAPESVIEAGVIHPDDIEAYREFYKGVYAGIPRNECTMRVKEDTRGWVWFTMYAQTIFDDDGNPIKAVAFSDDVTARKKAEIMYEQYRTAVTHDATYVWEVDLNENLLLHEDGASQQLFNQSGFTEYSDIIKIATENVPEVYREKVRDTFRPENLLDEFNQAKREVTLGYPFQGASEDDESWFESTAYMTTTPEGNVNAIICVRDVTQRKREEDRLRKAAERDSLCGLYNRKVFEQRVSDVLVNDRRLKGGHLFMIDIDDFKEYNDEFGHLVGDEIIKCIGDVLRNSFRDYDILSRFGGDEFMAFVTNFDSDAAVVRAGEIAESLKRADKLNHLTRPVTLSIGIAKAMQDDTFNTLYKKADEALYSAKSDGKGRCSVWVP